MSGRLYLQGRRPGEWDPVYWTESRVDAVLNPRVGDRKIHSLGELNEALMASRVRPVPTLKVWILGGLEGHVLNHEVPVG